MTEPEVDTWRAIWDLPGTPFPEWADFTDQDAAEAFAEQGVREGVAREYVIVQLPDQPEDSTRKATR